jgi:ATP-dependent DNA helicase RecG
MLELHSHVQYVKGIGPRAAAILANKDITTVEDLLYYLPFRYEDRLTPQPISELKAGQMGTVLAEVRASGLFKTPRKGMAIMQVTVAQGRQSLRCMWFNATYLRDRFKPGQILALFGRVEQNQKTGKVSLIQPQFEVVGEPEDDLSDAERALSQSLEVGRIVPIYEATGKLSSRWLRRVIHNLLTEMGDRLPDGIPPSLRQRLGLMPRLEAFWNVHWPQPGTDLQALKDANTPAHRRLIFEELFFLEVGLEIKRKKMRAQPGISFDLNDRVRAAIKKILPFHPTAAQKRVLREIAADMARPTPMRRLLQGDVGSGKTIVALEAAIVAIENGYQAALMAPTEILATQHYLSARRILEPAGYRIVLLTGSLEQHRKREIRRHIAQGNVHLVVGTHALIQEKVEFGKLGLAIVDEQHRFGVMQRFKLMKKRSEDLDPDVLVMTATPIPRTLALTLYGELDVSILDELPPGRSPIVTRRVPDTKSGEVWSFLRKHVLMGNQAYVVYPVIEEKPDPGFAAPSTPDQKPEPQPRLFEEEARVTLKAAMQMYEELRKKVFPDLKVGLIHGRLDADVKDDVMRRFAAGAIQVLVATTVIEVGVDVPNANVMVVEHAERFGLSQLHQLRGRIGRGAAKSYCILMTGPKITDEADQRLTAMVETSDGFQIAELDLKLRGPGEFFGTRQAGTASFRVADLLRDRELLELAKQEATAMVSGKAEVSRDEFALAVKHLQRYWQRRYGLVEVG